MHHDELLFHVVHQPTGLSLKPAGAELDAAVTLLPRAAPAG
ncbi:hypothetical protein [Actinacidiphila cocklensis]|uniref:Uncharacterized protein n=1 Tax=Actinacidiphila cocklensis TaxID=887465 RepID=A0A9W4GUB8_9ACTN|nr:hypothetical protein [Actinacidiphila cocklensis]WSX72719.1 hypothetical protein OH826_01890 [Streptomyces sp. NBC_00899]WSX81213.1 hypothetical protein OH826_49615 [Streptomyces sp. NBC_00899]CAG6397148.1 hypothetical protein SCOCK_50197 [Actinacidiphila cocklensis]